MNYKIKTMKTLVTDNGKEFGVGQDIAFSIFNTETNYHDKIIGEIKKIKNDSIIIKHIEINRNRVKGKKIILLCDIEKGSCNYVFSN